MINQCKNKNVQCSVNVTQSHKYFLQIMCLHIWTVYKQGSVNVQPDCTHSNCIVHIFIFRCSLSVTFIVMQSSDEHFLNTFDKSSLNHKKKTSDNLWWHDENDPPSGYYHINPNKNVLLSNCIFSLYTSMLDITHVMLCVRGQVWPTFQSPCNLTVWFTH